MVSPQDKQRKELALLNPLSPSLLLVPSLPFSLPLSPTSAGILQPQLKKKRTVSTPKPKDFHSKHVDKYCLQHQEEDSEGDIKTAIFKVGGGGWSQACEWLYSRNDVAHYSVGIHVSKLVTLSTRGETPLPCINLKIWPAQLSCLGGSVGRASA